MEWRESGLAIAPSAMPVRGAGLELIERALPYQLQTPTELKFLADGLRCVIHVPLSGLGA
jgi:hypothetical protein